MKIYIVDEEGKDVWAAKISYGNTPAFYVVCDEFSMLLSEIKQKGEAQFPCLLDNERTSIKIEKTKAMRIDIPDYIVDRALSKLPQREILGKPIPPSIYVPVDLELCPGVELSEHVNPSSPFVQRRGVLSKAEVLALEEIRRPIEARIVEKEGKLRWELTSSKGEQWYVDAVIEWAPTIVGRASTPKS